MTTLWIATKNPPFKRDGIDKPFFFNKRQKRLNSWTDAQTIEKAFTVFDKTYFNGFSTSGEIASTIDFQTFKIRLDQSGDVFRSSFFKVKFEKEVFNRYCWVIDTKYLGQNTIEFTLETDLWITFIPQIRFNDFTSIETKRFMPDRYVNLSGNKVNVWTEGNQFWDDLGKRSYEFEYKIPLKPLPTTDFSNKFKFFNKSETFIYGMLIPTEAMDAFKTGAVAPYLNNNDKVIPPAGLLIPLLPDDETLPTDPTGIDPTVWKDNKYNVVATQIANTVLAGIFILPIPTPPTNEINIPDATTTFPFALAKLTDTLGVISISKYGITDWLNSGSPVYDYSPYIATEKPFEFISTGVPLFSLFNKKNEPCYWNHQTAAIQINNGNSNGAEIPFEFLFSQTGITSFFNSKVVFSGTVLSIIHYLNFDFNIFTPDKIRNNTIFNDAYTTTFQTDMTLPSATTGWTNYMQNNRNSFYNSQAQGKFQATMGIVNGVMNPNATWGSLISSVGNSIFALKAQQAQIADMKNQAGALNNVSLDAAGMMIKAGIINENAGVAFNYREALVGVPYVKRVPTDMQDNIIKHYRLFGNPVQQRLTLSFEKLQKREFWNYWEIEDIQNTFIFDNIPPFVIDALDKMFSDGVRLWPIHWGADETVIDTIYKYDNENWETNLEIT